MSSRRLVILFLAFVGLYAVGDWALPLVDRDEPRFAEASREMLERGDYVVPYFNDAVRYDKPPLIYWLQAASYKLIGGARGSEFAARLPSGICAALAAVVIAIWGTQLYDAKTGMRAAVMFGLCLQTIIHAHAAVADMAMVAAVAASGWAGWNWLLAHRELPQERPRGRMLRWWAAYWALLAAGFLAKGPIALIPIGMAGWGAAKMERGTRPGALEWLGGLALMTALVGTWGIPALLRTHGQFAAVGLGKHVWMRSVSTMEGHGARNWSNYFALMLFYLVTVWPSFFPWSIWLVPAARELWSRRREWRVEEVFLVTGVLLVFGIFSLIRTRLPHYTLPAFPFMSLLIAAWWGKTHGNRTLRRAARWMVGFGLVLGLAAMPLARRYFASQELYDLAAPWLTPRMEMASVGYHEPSLVWLFRKKIDGYDSPINWKDAESWMQKPGPRVCVIQVVDLGKAFRKLDPRWKVVETRGFKVANARWVELAAVIKT